MKMGKVLVEQVGQDITQGLDDNADPEMHIQSLTPEYCNAALNYAADQYNQLYSKLSLAVFWHPVTALFLTAVNVGFVGFRYRELVEYNGWQVLYQIQKHDPAVMVQSLMFFMATFAMPLLYAKMSGDFLGEASSSIAKDNGKEAFGADLKQFAYVEEKHLKRLSKMTLDNVKIIVYRECPIAVVSVLNDATIFRVSVLSVKKVYVKAGLFEDLVDLAVKHAKESAGNGPFSLKIESYSFDKELSQLLAAKGFEKISSIPLPGLLGSLYGFEKNLYLYEQ